MATPTTQTPNTQTQQPPQTETQPAQPAQPRARRRLWIGAGVAAMLLIVIVGTLSIGSSSNASLILGDGNSLLVLALPVFLAGVLSFLSPCTLPILPGYFAFTFQASKHNIVLMTIAFFLGLATTMTLLGTTATALGALLAGSRDTLSFWGGLLIIGFGVLSLLGKGFAGPQFSEQPTASAFGSYLFGATFALGWTACVGPILGALFTLLLTAQGVAVVQGAVLSFIFAMGMGLPLILLATFFSRMDRTSRFWQIMRGRGFAVQLGSWTLHLHTTSVISGLLLILMGWLLASGQLIAITQFAESSPLAQWLLIIEGWITQLFGL